MARQIGKIPRHGSIRLAQRVGAVDQRDIIQLLPADALGLQDPKQAGLVEITLGLGRKPTQLFSLSGALAQLGDERSGPGDHDAVGTGVLPRGAAGIGLVADLCH